MKIFMSFARLRPGVLLSALLLLSTIAACKHAPRDERLESATTTGPAALHAVHSQELRQVMLESSGNTFERLPQELDQARQRREQLAEVARVAESMMLAANKIPAIAGDVQLEPREQELFITLASRLSTQAAQLKVQAEQMAMNSTQQTLQEIGATCISCHTLFRDPDAARLGLSR